MFSLVIKIEFLFKKKYVFIICYKMEGSNPDVQKIKDRVYPTLLKGLTILCKEKPDDPIRFLANWLIENNPYKPRAVVPTESEPLTPFDSRLQTPV